ncbi:hypothetical protein JOC33_000726 [Thalassobacillus pellis]|nr:hypothetical protein [Thalassobacillus pellis]
MKKSFIIERGLLKLVVDTHESLAGGCLPRARPKANLVK